MRSLHLQYHRLLFNANMTVHDLNPFIFTVVLLLLSGDVSVKMGVEAKLTESSRNVNIVLSTPRAAPSEVDHSSIILSMNASDLLVAKAGKERLFIST